MKLLLALCVLLVVPPIAMAQHKPLALNRNEIKQAEQRLSDLGYWTGPIDGIFDAGSRSAVIAFQKWHRRKITDQLTIADLEAIRNSSAPQAREIGYEHVEVDLDRQVLMLVNEDGSVRVLPTSTGSGKEFIDEGQSSISYTPRGRFLVYDKSTGWETGPLGSVYYPNYISGGVAIHGSRNVPSEPASHGCIRVPMFAAREVSKLLKLGTIVLVYDKVSFVSAKDWIRDPAQRRAAMLSAAITGSDDFPAESVIKKPRPPTVRS